MTTLPLADGARGNLQTLARMREFARRGGEDARIRLLALDIVGACDARDHACEARAIHMWVKRNIKFRRDPVGVEWLQDVERTLMLRSGDCDDISVLVAALLRSIGHMVRFRVGGYGNGFTHVWVIDLLDGRWVDIDASVESAEFGWSRRYPVRADYAI